jgi:hypothetical protein
MSVSGISLSSYLNQNSQIWQTKAQKIYTEFQQLGRDLQAGKLSQAQTDFSAMSQDLPGAVQSNNSLSPAFSALRSAHHHYHLVEVGSQGATSSTGSALSQLLSSLGSALQAGNLSAAQAAYSTLQQDLEQLGRTAGTAPQSTAGALNITG